MELICRLLVIYKVSKGFIRVGFSYLCKPFCFYSCWLVSKQYIPGSGNYKHFNFGYGSTFEFIYPRVHKHPAYLDHLVSFDMWSQHCGATGYFNSGSDIVFYYVRIHKQGW